MSMNPILTKNTIQRDYLAYLASILSVRDQDITKKALEALHHTIFVKGSFLETTPPFEPGKSLQELCGEQIVCEEFEKIAEDIHYERSLYIHQEEAIRKISCGRKNVIVATGTGSGKTECYLLPIFNELMNQKKKGILAPGVRALLMFPMNALANDQLKKLRQLLAHYPEITFGRYTGETSFNDEVTARREYEQKYHEKPLDNEILSREKMQKEPPHILLTNYAMLEYLLLRPEDSVFFDSEYAQNWRFLVLDEAHTYKGANGTEIALLIRRLKERVNHHTQSSLQCIATSATLGSEDAKDALAEFAQNIFGEPFYAEDIITSKKIKRDYQPDMRPFSPSDYEKIKASIQNLDQKAQEIIAYQELIKDRRVIDAHRVLEKKPRQTSEVADLVFSDLPSSEERMNALISLIDLATLAKPDTNSAALLPARYHLFVKSLEGMFISMYPRRQVYLDRKEKIAENGMGIPVFELANCQRCGQEYLVGKTTEDGFLRQVNELDKPEYFLFSKQATFDSDLEFDDDDDAFEASDIKKLEKYVLCTACGKIVPVDEADGTCCEVNDKGKLIVVYKLNYSGQRKDANTCAKCGAVSPSIIKRFLTANQPATFAVANSLYSMIPPKKVQAAKLTVEEDDFFTQNIASINPEYEEESGRKLLVFSDNRQEAAFFAGYMNNKYNQIMWRRLILKELKANPNGLRVDELIDRLVIQADRAGLFCDDGCNINTVNNTDKTNLAAKYVIQEFMGTDRITGLEGRGYIEIYPEPIQCGNKWGLSNKDTWDFLRFTMDTLRYAGAIVYPDHLNAADEFFAPRNREVYFRKEKRGNYRGKDILSFIAGKNRQNKRMRYIKKILQLQEVPEDQQQEKALEIIDEAYRLLAKLAQIGYFLKSTLGTEGEAYAVNFRKWYIRYLSDDTVVYCCNKCGKVFPYEISCLCPEFKCDGTLEPLPVAEIRKEPYYYDLYHNTKIIPMIAKEHTAQLTKEAAGDYQKSFEEGKINVLSCSTTFEMGVDVGELEATFLRNVPPETANYIQRAGRAGRRTSSTAFSVTFARRNSHDINFFNHPSEIISGKIKPPYIEITNDKVAIRHVNSVIMAWFFKKRPVYFEDGVKALVGYGSGIDVVGALREELSSRPDYLMKSIITVLPNELVRRMDIAGWNFVDRLVGEEGTLTNAIKARKSELDHLNNLRNKLFEQNSSINAVNSLINTYKEEKTINFLASNGVLPKYGFPIDVVKLNILNNSEDAKRVDLSRDLRIAISEFAPPGSVVANGKVWTSYCINTIPDKGWPTYRYYECPRCKRISPPENLVVLDQNDEGQFKECTCGEQMKAKQFIIPKFGFSTSIDEKAKPVGENRPKHAYATRTQFWGIGELDSYLQEQRKGAEIQICGKIIKAEYSPNGKLVVLNRGINGSGLWTCKVCGFVKEFPNDPKHKNKFGHDCPNNHLSNVSLGHIFATDILRIELPYHIGRFDHAGKDTRLSVLYAVLDGASDELGVARSDINGCIDYEHGNTAMILYDESAGGAGHVKRIFDHMESVFSAALKRVNGECGCSEETSCYGCLRNYGNQFDHDKLVRGGAKEYLSWLLYGIDDHTSQCEQEEMSDSTETLSVVQPILSKEWTDCIALVSSEKEVHQFVFSLAARNAPVPDEVGQDIAMPDGNGILCEAELYWNLPNNMVIALVRDNTVFAEKCRSLGYKVFVIGDDSVESVLQAIQ